MTEALIGKLGYLGIALLLVLGGLGLPIPEEAPIILAAILSKNEQMWWPLALASCFIGVLVGDFVVYFLGYFHGEKVLSLPLTRRFLTRAREVQIKGYFHRHGFKILILGRFAVGFRTAAYLTAGTLKLPFVKLLITDIVAASLSTCLLFGLGYIFAHHIQSSFDKVKHWLTAIVAIVLIAWLLYRYYKGRERAGLRVGPPVLVSDDAPLPPDDLHANLAKQTEPTHQDPATGPDPDPVNAPADRVEHVDPALPVLEPAADPATIPVDPGVPILEADPDPGALPVDTAQPSSLESNRP